LPGDLLRKWWKEGTAAGNVGDWYDNRDRGHSDLHLAPYPQLQRVVYSPEELRRRQDWALTLRTRPFVTFGNSSTSAPPTLGGSNPRHAYCWPGGLALLYRQYRGNNVYVYPEHQDHDQGPWYRRPLGETAKSSDHDPGHNGRPDGYGDLYPANSPYLITSQGSSGSDQPFMRALPLTLAAFRPEVKARLVKAGLLMPTVQMILRSSNKHLKGPKDYLTGKAHPTVFEGSLVDELKMVRLAHDIRRDNIPPMVQLKVVKEDVPLNGRDYFEPEGLTEKLADTPCVIARVWRGKDFRRRLVVSAEGSYDLSRRPLTFHWVLLRGDPRRVTIRPLNRARSVAELVVAYHERRPIAPGAALESNRVDVGVFVHNGVYHSAPGFVTFFSLDCEGRTYQDGRLVEIGYGLGETVLNVPDHGALFAALADGPGGKLLKLTPGERAALRKTAEEYRPLRRARERTQALVHIHQRFRADLAGARLQGPLKVAEGKLRELERALATLTGKLNAVLDGKRAGLKEAPRAFAERVLKEKLADGGLFEASAGLLARAPAGRKAAVEAARSRLAGLGVKLPPPRRLTAYERAQFERLGGVLLAELAFPGVLGASYQVNFVDQRLTVPKTWRDVYHHDGPRLRGWTRYDGVREQEFTAEGLLVLKKDGRGRVLRARTVRYRLDLPYSLASPKPLKPVLGDEVVTYEYDGDTPRVKGREKVKEGS
jgi:hypothetical protein